MVPVNARRETQSLGMSDPRQQDEAEALRRLMELARDRTRTAQRILVENMTDLYVSADSRLSERERALMNEILVKLVREMEFAVRKALAERLAGEPNAPREIVRLLANDQIEIARPLLRNSAILQDPDLIEIVQHRTQDHLLAVAMRPQIGKLVADAIVERGEPAAIEALLRNGDAAISQRTLEFLVAESERVDRFQEPLVRRADLPPRLAARMLWWVSAALRVALVERFEVDAALVDFAIDSATRAVIDAPARPSLDAAARLMVDGLNDDHPLDERFLLHALRGGRPSAFVAGFARLAQLDARVVRRLIGDATAQGLTIACRALGLERSAVASILLLVRRGQSGVVPPGAVAQSMAFFDSLDRRRCEVVLRHWRMDAEYLAARDALEAGRAIRGTG
jgi:uncharacterized protein (DUF2336 family)